VWCYRSPETLAIFTPIPGDTLSTVMNHAITNLKCDPSVDKIVLLSPGLKRPVDPAQINAAKPGKKQKKKIEISSPTVFHRHFPGERCTW
jgi:hypothetical protein